MEIDAKKKIWLSLLLFVAIFCLAIFFAVVPLFKELKDKSETLKSKAEEKAKAEKEIQTIASFNSLKEEKEEVFSAIKNGLVNYSAPVEFFEFLENLAKENYLLIDISPLAKEASAESSPVLQEINFEILAAGSFNDNLKFIKEVENSPFFAEVYEMSLDKITEESKPPKPLEGASIGEVLLRMRLRVLTEEKNEVKK